MVFVATTALNVNGPRPAGCRVPEAESWDPYVLQNHIRNGSIRDVSEEEADRMYAKAREVIREDSLKRLAKALTRAVRDHNEAVAGLSLVESQYEAAVQHEADMKAAVAAVEAQIKETETGDAPEIGQPGMSERRLRKAEAKAKAEAEAKAKAKKDAEAEAAREARKAKKQAMREGRKLRREKLDGMSVRELKGLAEEKQIPELPKNKADIVEHIAQFLDNLEVLSEGNPEDGTDG